MPQRIYDDKMKLDMPFAEAVILRDATILPRQILLYRDLVRSIFLPG